MTTPSRPSRKERRLLRLNSAVRATSNCETGGTRTSANRNSENARRVQELLRDRKRAEESARCAHASTAAVIRMLGFDPELQVQARVVAFVAASTALVGSDAELGERMGAVMASLSSEAAQIVLADLETGPRVIANLARDNDRMCELAALPPVAQAVELGRLVADLTSTRRAQQPVNSQPATSGIFGLYQTHMPEGTP